MICNHTVMIQRPQPLIIATRVLKTSANSSECYSSCSPPRVRSDPTDHLVPPREFERTEGVRTRRSTLSQLLNARLEPSALQSVDRISRKLNGLSYRCTEHLCCLGSVGDGGVGA